MADRVGQRLGNYRLVHLLGQGGFADVYLSRHIHLDTPAAVKVLHTHLSNKYEESFRTEALTIAKLVHPHIVRMLDYGIEKGTPFLVMDYAPGGTVREICSQSTLPSLAAVVSYVKQIASALQYAHEKKLIHRDVKPENMLLGQHGEILLSDFGIALMAQSSHVENLHQAAGTVQYMAPEQLQGRPRRASDQYALGIVVYEWLCGLCPFYGSFHEIASQHILVAPPSLRERVPVISPEIEQVVMKALAKEPEQRFANVEAFAAALEQAYLLSKEFSPLPSLNLSTFPTFPAAPKRPAPRQTRVVVLERIPSQPTLTAPLASLDHISAKYTLKLPQVLPNHLPSEVFINLSADHSLSIAEPFKASASSPPPSSGRVSLFAKLGSLFFPANLPGLRITQSNPFLTKKTAFLIGLIFLFLLGLLSPALLNLLPAPAHSLANSKVMPSNAPVLTLSSSSVSIGQNVILHLSHFSHFSRVFLTRDAQERIKASDATSYVNVGANGAARLALPLDETWNPGYHTIQAEDITTHYTANATLHIASGPTRPAHLIIDADTLDLGAAIQGANTIQPLKLYNTGSGSITWAASSNQSWLMTSPQQGTLSDSQTITIGGERANLQPGDYQGSITFFSNAGASSTVQVSMSVLPSADTLLTVAPALLSFTAFDGGSNPQAQLLTVNNPGSQPLRWSLANPASNTSGANGNWLSTDQASGTIAPHAANFILVAVQSQSLLPGTYTNTLVLSANQGKINGSQAISISLTVRPRCGLQLNSGGLYFSAVSGQGNPGQQTVTISASASCLDAIDWHATPSAQWITVSLSQGRLADATMNVTTAVGVNVQGLQPGTYTAPIIFSTGQSTQSILVQLVIQALPTPTSPIMSASPLNLNFSAIQGQANPPSQTISLTNTGGSTLYWRSASSMLTSFWFAASPSGGQIAPGQTIQINTRVDVEKLNPGTYTAQLTFFGVDAKNISAGGSPLTIIVTLVVSAPCTLPQPSSSALFFSAVRGGSDPTPQSVDITAYGSCAWPLSWSASMTSAVPWLKLSPLSGSFNTSGQLATLSLAPSIAGLAPGTYQAQISINATDTTRQQVQGSLRVISVTLTIT